MGIRIIGQILTKSAIIPSPDFCARRQFQHHEPEIAVLDFGQHAMAALRPAGQQGTGLRVGEDIAQQIGLVPTIKQANK